MSPSLWIQETLSAWLPIITCHFDMGQIFSDPNNLHGPPVDPIITPTFSNAPHTLKQFPYMLQCPTIHCYQIRCILRKMVIVKKVKRDMYSRPWDEQEEQSSLIKPDLIRRRRKKESAKNKKMIPSLWMQENLSAWLPIFTGHVEMGQHFSDPINLH